MSEAKIAGRIKAIMAENVISEKFKKREFVITTQSEYPQDIIIEFVQDKCSILDNFRESDLVDVSVNIRGREWINPQGEAKYFNTLQAWRIEKIGNEGSSAGHPSGMNGEMAQAEFDQGQEEDDDLPF